MIALLAKAALTIVTVLVLAEISRRVSPTLAGVISGLPLGSGLTMIFVAVEQGPAFALEAAPWGILGLTASLAFSLAYLLAGRAGRAARGFGRLAAVAASTAAALAAFVAAALALRHLRVGLGGAVAITVAAAAANLAILARIPGEAGGAARASGSRSLLLRAAVAGALVAAVTAAARAVGSAWTGLFSGFPMVLMPLYIVLQFEEGQRLYPGVIRGFALGVTNLVLFYLLLPVLLPRLGVAAGFVAVYAFSAVYLWGLNAAREAHARRRGAWNARTPRSP
jgi:hypothetical protein